MVTIISGGKNEGKTRKICSLYKKLQTGDGIISLKIFRDNFTSEGVPDPDTGYTGYEIVHLATGEKRPLAYKLPYIPKFWDEGCRLGQYSFSQAAFDFTRQVLLAAVERGIYPLFIDEIGPLELSGKGFASILREILAGPGDVYLTTRTQCLDEVVNTFHIHNYHLLGTAVEGTVPTTKKYRKKMGGKFERSDTITNEPAGDRNAFSTGSRKRPDDLRFPCTLL